MGNFFRDLYDLYKTISSDPEGTPQKLRQVVYAATREDLEQDIKDSCVTILEKDGPKDASAELGFLFELLEQKIGVS